MSAVRNKALFTDFLNYIPSLIMLVFSMVALHFSIVLINSYDDIVNFEKHKDHSHVSSHVSSADDAGFAQYESQIKRAERNLYWAVIAIGLAGFVMVLVNNEQYRRLQKAQKAHKKSQEEHEELQTQLYQAQKMEAIGRLAGGIAHDFNNILAAMNGYAEFLIEDLDEESEAHGFAGNILQAGQQARDLVDQIMAFSRHKDGVFEHIDLVRAVNESASMLNASLPKTIEMQTDIVAQSAFIYGNPTQISQVIMNLCVNAKDAMEDEHGRLKICIKALDIQDLQDFDFMFDEDILEGEDNVVPIKIEELGNKVTRLTLGAFVKDVRYARLSVSDTGTGMSRTIMEHIFEPFFTTKPVEKGTGLGLSMIHGVIADHNGAMIINSTLDLGTRFELFFPLLDEEHVEKTEEAQLHSFAASARILIVEDQAGVRDMTANMLGRIGHEVFTCENGLDALDFLRENIGLVDLVITDQNMPKMTGLEMINEASEDFPDLPFIVLSGYSEEKLRLLMEGHRAIKAILRKPVARDDLEQAIINILDDDLTLRTDAGASA